MKCTVTEKGLFNNKNEPIKVGTRLEFKGTMPAAFINKVKVDAEEPEAEEPEAEETKAEEPKAEEPKAEPKAEPKTAPKSA